MMLQTLNPNQCRALQKARACFTGPFPFFSAIIVMMFLPKSFLYFFVLPVKRGRPRKVLGQMNQNQMDGANLGMSIILYLLFCFLLLWTDCLQIIYIVDKIVWR